MEGRMIDAVLMVIVCGTLLLALSVDVAALAAWLRKQRRWR
jgi:hypothetical protein